MKFTAKQIAGLLQGEIEGNPETVVNTFAKIEEGIEGAISFLANPHYEHYIYNTKSSIVLVNKAFKPSQSIAATLIRVPDAYAAIAKLLSFYEAQTAKRSGIHPTACIEDSATVGSDCYIGPHVYIGEHVIVGKGTQIYANTVIEKGARIGEDCLLYPNVSVYHDCVLGNGVTLHSGCVIGADGFGFAPSADGYDKIPQIGNVVIEDDVEIGANSCVDRSTMGATYVRHGVKLDNLVQVAHNCDVGANTVMAAQGGVAGSTKIGQWCMFGGQVGIAGHAVIGDRTMSGAQAGIAGSIRKGHVTVQGSPAIDARIFARASVVFKNLPDMYNDFNRMKVELENLKQHQS